MSETITMKIRQPDTRHHALEDGEREQQERIFRRNALLNELYPDDRRLAYAAMSSQAPLADDVTIEPVDAEQAHGWWIQPHGAKPGKAIFYVHGGGYHLGDAKSYLGFVSQIAALTQCAVFSVDYALAPEHRFPIAYDDVRKAQAWLASRDITEYAAVGDSAGGGLILSLASPPTAKGAKLASIVVFSPWTDLSNSGDSFNDPHISDPVFKPAVIEGLARSYLDGASATDPKASPLFAIPRDLPPLYIQVGSDEILKDDATRYAQQAAAKGNDVRLDIYEGMYHVFQRDVGTLNTSRLALGHASAFITASWTAASQENVLG